MATIAFIGTGIMGAAMAGHLMDGGHSLRVYNRTKAKAQGLLDRGALWCDTIGACVENADYVFTIVGYPADVEQVYLAPGGIIENAQAGAYLIDMTTSSPGLAARIYDAAGLQGLFALDAPVSGGDTGAKNASLAIMVGGAEDAFLHCKPLFELMGKNIIYIGGPGAGQHCKMANQIVVAGTVASVSEAIAYARNMGVDEERVLQCIGGGAAASWQLANNGPKMIQGDYAPGFYIKHFCKDMRIALAEAEQKGVRLNALKAVYEMYQTLCERGMEDLGTQAIIRYFE